MGARSLMAYMNKGGQTTTTMRLAVFAYCIAAAHRAGASMSCFAAGVHPSGVDVTVPKISCAGRCIVAHYMKNGLKGRACPNNFVRVGCAVEDSTIALNANTMSGGNFSTSMCNATGLHTISESAGVYNARYLCTGANENSLAAASKLVVEEPGIEDWECSVCSGVGNLDSRREKKAITALLLQLFLGHFGAGALYYERMDLGAGLLVLGLVPCLLLCCVCCVTAARRDTGDTPFTHGLGGSGSGAPLEVDMAIGSCIEEISKGRWWVGFWPRLWLQW